MRARPPASGKRKRVAKAAGKNGQTAFARPPGRFVDKRPAMFRHCSLVLAGVLMAGCVGGGKSLSSEDRDRLKAYVLTSPPADMQKLDVNFENKVHLIGYKFEP